MIINDSARLGSSVGGIGAAAGSAIARIAEDLFLDLDMVNYSLKQLAENLAELPQSEQVAMHRGPAGDVAGQFHTALGNTTAAAAIAVTEMRQHLLDADASVRAAVAALTANDEDAQLAVSQVQGALDSNVAAVDSAPASDTGANTAAEATVEAGGAVKRG